MGYVSSRRHTLSCDTKISIHLFDGGLPNPEVEMCQNKLVHFQLCHQHHAGWATHFSSVSASSSEKQVNNNTYLTEKPWACIFQPDWRQAENTLR